MTAPESTNRRMNRPTSERSPICSENIGEVDLRPRPSRCLSAGNLHHLIYPSSPAPHPILSLIPSNISQCHIVLPSVPVIPTPILIISLCVHAQQQHLHAFLPVVNFSSYFAVDATHTLMGNRVSLVSCRIC